MFSKSSWRTTWCKTPLPSPRWKRETCVQRSLFSVAQGVVQDAHLCLFSLLYRSECCLCRSDFSTKKIRQIFKKRKGQKVSAWSTNCDKAGKAIICDLRNWYGYWFLTTFVLVAWERQQKMVPVWGHLLHVWETLEAPGSWLWPDPALALSPPEE